MADEAIEWVRRAVQLGNENYPLFADSRKLDSLRGDPRFQDLLDELKRRWERRVQQEVTRPCSRRRSIELSGGFTLPAPPEATFQLFSPLGREEMGPGLGPGARPSSRRDVGARPHLPDARGAGRGDLGGHRPRSRSARGRVLPGRGGALRGAGARPVRLPLPASHTEVRVTYTFVGLSDAGNQDIDAMSPQDYEEKMAAVEGVDHDTPRGAVAVGAYIRRPACRREKTTAPRS